MGSTDTGNGVRVTDDGVMCIVEKCRGLRVLQLTSCTSVTDHAFAAMLERLGELEELHCTGHDRSNGRLTCKALDPLITEAAPKLRQLYLTDQGVGYDSVAKLVKARGKSGLQVQAGQSDSDSFAWGSVMRQMGRSYGDGLYGNAGGGGGGAKRGGRGGGGRKRGNKRAKLV
ncbi:hypothetical protein TSOC_009082 [Tetrabaena socialis]|uniref:Uncharacterized protein n=1 Tax=Tetrabaena socialis TaxID=47790 RepID=A0A2J7ZWW2_9CHLO|nr:hypothetical protein TSOC_009082 [Tetrabaena socialis]|eukprot:PNH04742.1 hypothetical protein TSOC_009082 [Tetrabaena socialis]